MPAGSFGLWALECHDPPSSGERVDGQRLECGLAGIISLPPKSNSVSPWSPPASGPFQPQQGYGGFRLQALMDMIRDQVSGAQVSEIIEGWLEFYSATVRLDNGLSLLVSTDADVPEVLFEVMRFVDLDRPQRFAFEARAGLGSFYSDKLPSQTAVDLLNQYRAADATPPAGSSSASD